MAAVLPNTISEEVSFDGRDVKSKPKIKNKKLLLNNPKWLAGDLLWAKMKGYPWWPCMVSYDPLLSIHSRVLGSSMRQVTQYHVQFFGHKAVRRWMCETSTLKYDGSETIEDLKYKAMNGKMKDRAMKINSDWSDSIKQADEAIPLTRKERLFRYSFDYSRCLKSNLSPVAVQDFKVENNKRKSLKDVDMESSASGGTECSGTRSENNHDTKNGLGRGTKNRARSWSGAKRTPKNYSTNAKSVQKNTKPGMQAEINSMQKPDLTLFKLSNTISGSSKKQNICQVCELLEEEAVIVCDGPCLGVFHPSCIGLVNVPQGVFKCDECVSGIHTCFVCKSASASVSRCNVPSCGRFFHEQCARSLRLSRVKTGSIRCPMHACATCAADDCNDPLASKGRLLRCLRCPTAYHASEFCLAAGSQIVGGSNIVCSHHSDSTATDKHVNVNWCFLCSAGGTLLCCESCPAAFHASCLKISPPDGVWMCEECTSGKRPLYGEIIWTKMAAYRWWPAEICHPKHVPSSVTDRPHSIGQFPVQFFGTHNYFWTSVGRVYQFQEGDKGSKDSASKGLDKSFSRAIKEANIAIRLWNAEKEKREKERKERADQVPPTYKTIKQSIAVGNVSVNRECVDDLPRCHCTSDMAEPCGPDSNCINRLLLCECHPSLCTAGDKCLNQRFQRREFKTVVPFKTENRGWGLKTTEDIKDGEFIIEYVGELIDEAECKRRLDDAQSRNEDAYFLLTLDKNRIIDAGPRGNASRFMNHSCLPNCVTQKWNINGDIRIGLFSIKDIPAGSELTFNYNLDCLGNEKKACKCGEPVCSGLLGVQPKTRPSLENKRDALKKKKKRSFSKQHEDECFRCGGDGQLIMCDKISCPKVYHLDCLDITTHPRGKWICPWHHCDECGKPAAKLCSECDNSYCSEHVQGNIAELVSGLMLCSDCTDSEYDFLTQDSGMSVGVENDVGIESERMEDLDAEHQASVQDMVPNESLKNLLKAVEPNEKSVKPVIVSVEKNTIDMSKKVSDDMNKAKKSRKFKDNDPNQQDFKQRRRSQRFNSVEMERDDLTTESSRRSPSSSNSAKTEGDHLAEKSYRRRSENSLKSLKTKEDHGTIESCRRSQRLNIAETKEDLIKESSIKSKVKSIEKIFENKMENKIHENTLEDASNERVENMVIDGGDQINGSELNSIQSLGCIESGQNRINNKRISKENYHNKLESLPRRQSQRFVSVEIEKDHLATESLSGRSQRLVTVETVKGDLLTEPSRRKSQRFTSLMVKKDCIELLPKNDELVSQHDLHKNVPVEKEIMLKKQKNVAQSADFPNAQRKDGPNGEFFLLDGEEDMFDEQVEDVSNAQEDMQDAQENEQQQNLFKVHEENMFSELQDIEKIQLISDNNNTNEKELKMLRKSEETSAICEIFSPRRRSQRFTSLMPKSANTETELPINVKYINLVTQEVVDKDDIQGNDSPNKLFSFQQKISMCRMSDDQEKGILNEPENVLDESEADKPFEQREVIAEGQGENCMSLEHKNDTSQSEYTSDKLSEENKNISDENKLKMARKSEGSETEIIPRRRSQRFLLVVNKIDHVTTESTVSGLNNSKSEGQQSSQMTEEICATNRQPSRRSARISSLAIDNNDKKCDVIQQCEMNGAKDIESKVDLPVGQVSTPSSGDLLPADSNVEKLSNDDQGCDDVSLKICSNVLLGSLDVTRANNVEDDCKLKAASMVDAVDDILSIIDDMANDTDDVKEANDSRKVDVLKDKIEVRGENLTSKVSRDSRNDLSPFTNLKNSFKAETLKRKREIPARKCKRYKVSTSDNSFDQEIHSSESCSEDIGTTLAGTKLLFTISKESRDWKKSDAIIEANTIVVDSKIEFPVTSDGSHEFAENDESLETRNGAVEDIVGSVVKDVVIDNNGMIRRISKRKRMQKSIIHESNSQMQNHTTYNNASESDSENYFFDIFSEVGSPIEVNPRESITLQRQISSEGEIKSPRIVKIPLASYKARLNQSSLFPATYQHK